MSTAEPRDDFPVLDKDALCSVLTAGLDWSQQCSFATVSKQWHEAVEAALSGHAESLNVRRFATAVTDDTLANIARRCPRLRSINLAGATALTSDGLAALKGCPRLETLNLACGPKVKADALEALCVALPALQSLEMGGCLGSELTTEQTVRRFGHWLDLDDDEDGLSQVQG